MRRASQVFFCVLCLTRPQSSSAPSKADPKKKGGDKKAKKVKKVEKPAIHDYKRVDRKQAAQIKEQQTKQRALAVARVIAQASQSLVFWCATAFLFFFPWSILPLCT